MADLRSLPIEMAQTCIEVEYKDAGSPKIKSYVDGVTSDLSCSDRLNIFRLIEAPKKIGPNPYDRFSQMSCTRQTWAPYVTGIYEIKSQTAEFDVTRLTGNGYNTVITQSASTEKDLELTDHKVGDQFYTAYTDVCTGYASAEYLASLTSAMTASATPAPTPQAKPKPAMPVIIAPGLPPVEK